jgi:hypothetical protein
MLDPTRALLAVLATSLSAACQFPDYDIIEAQLGGSGADSSPEDEPSPAGAGGAGSDGGGSNVTAGSAPALPEDCRLANGYFACAQIVNFEAAEEVCESQGRKLARIDDATENAVVTEIARTLGPYVWLGAKKEGSGFEWLDGTVFYDDGEVHGVYSNLVLRSGNDDTTLRCVQIENSGAWTPAHCTDTQQFICE